MDGQNGYQVLADKAMRDTVAIIPLAEELEGKEGVLADAMRAGSWGTGIVIAGEWKGKPVAGILTAGHVVEAFTKVKGMGLVVVGRMRTGEMRKYSFVKVVDTQVIKGGKLLLEGHREIVHNDIGLLRVDGRGAGSGIERLRSDLSVVGYNPSRERRPFNGTDLAKAVCGSGNQEEKRLASEERMPVEVVAWIDQMEQGRGIGWTVDGGEPAEREMWIARIEGTEGDVRGMSGSGVWRECHPGDGGAELVGVVGSYLRDWPPQSNGDHVLLVPVADALNQLTGQRDT